MNQSKCRSQFQEQVAYSNISQFLQNEDQKSNYQQLSNELTVNLFRNFSSVSVQQNLFSQKRMDHEQSDDFNQISDSSYQDQQGLPYSKVKNKKCRKSFKNKESKNKFYARNYRQKKKEMFKSLQEENRFLKSKIDDLTYRLKQTEIELNKYKYSYQPHGQSCFQSTRQSLIKQINELMMKQDSQIQKLIKLQQQLKTISAFDSKHKIDSLNYFMGELLENLINDMGFYFIDSLISQKGIWKLNSNSQGRQIDYQICQLLSIPHFEGIKRVLNSIPQFNSFLKNFKNQWKKLYQDYLKIVSLGNMVESLCKPLFQRKNKEDLSGRVLGSLKLQLYFQRIKYRKDMRQLRQSWFHQIEFQSESVKKIKSN